MSFLERVLDGEWITLRRNFEKLERSMLDTGGVSLKLRGPYTADTGGVSIASGAEKAVVVTHDLGAAPVFAFGFLKDAGAGWSHQFQWRAEFTSTNMTITFLNHGPNVGRAILTFYVIL